MRTFSYRTAPTSLKLTITGLLLLAVVGLGVAALQVYVRTGMTPTGALMHYRGNEATLQYPKSFAEMVGITHAHGFTMPMLAFVLSAAFLATGAREWLKRVVVVALFTGMVLELGVPWLVRYGPAWTVHLFPLSGVLLFGGLFASVGLPIYEMWLSSAKPVITVARRPHPLQAPRRPHPFQAPEEPRHRRAG